MCVGGVVAGRGERGAACAREEAALACSMGGWVSAAGRTYRAGLVKITTCACPGAKGWWFTRLTGAVCLVAVWGPRRARTGRLVLFGFLPRRGPLMLATLVVSALGCIFLLNVMDLLDSIHEADKPVRAAVSVLS